MPHDVFISYSHKDAHAAETVCSVLEKNEVPCWMAPRDITPGVPFAEAIIDGIKGSKVFILLYSSNSNHSVQVIKEVDRAVHHGLAIIPLRLEDVPMTKQLEYYVSDVHWLDALTPPLENHIDKLYKVVQMLLTMDDVDSEDIKEAIRTGTVKPDKSGKPGKSKSSKPGTIIKQRRFLIPAAVALLAFLIIAAGWYSKRQAKIRWARQEAIPEIERLIGENDAWRNLVEPYRLAERAEEILGKDPHLAELFSQISLYIDLITEPAGAAVYIKDYGEPEEDWNYLGLTPLENIRMPIGIFRWKMEKEGYETVIAAESTWNVGSEQGKTGIVTANNILRTLDPVGSMPPGMVRVPETETVIGPLGSFFIGRYEVTNSEYKTFVDAGGYRQKEYWKHPFINDAQELSWDAAMRMFKDQSEQPGPSIWMGGDYHEGQGDYPVSGVSWYEAAAYAEYSGMTLPTAVHWNVARGSQTPMIQWRQLGGFAILAPFSNFFGQGTVEVGSLSGITAYGAYDMAGNVREWCLNETPAGRIIRGGSWEDNTYEFGNRRQAPAMNRSSRNGIRLAFYPEPEEITEDAFNPMQLFSKADINELKPVPDEIFQVYKEQFAYDNTELNARVEYREESPGGWIREKISFDAAYGGERMLAYLFLPVNVSPPYQTVIYFPGSASSWMTSSEDMEGYYEFSMFLSFLVRNGRAVLYPLYKGTFERLDPALAGTYSPAENYAYTEYLTQIVKDFRRSIDYLETRPDIDTARLAYYGMSWGGMLGAIIPAVEERLGASILLAGSLDLRGRPEANAINYVTRVQTPTLMLNGEYDYVIDEGIKPMFRLLGTPPEHKRQIIYETDHIPPRVEYIKETLSWLDKYLGPVR